MKTYIIMLMLCFGLVFPVSVYAENENAGMQNEVFNEDSDHIGFESDEELENDFEDDDMDSDFDIDDADPDYNEENDLSEIISTAEIQVSCTAKKLDNEFIFTLVPENKENQAITFDRLFLSDGETESFKIGYTETGVYRYTILQNIENEDNDHVQYDSTVYSAKVEIQNANGKNISDVVIYKNGSDAKTDMCRFTNEMIDEEKEEEKEEEKQEEEKDKDKDKDKEKDKDKDKENTDKEHDNEKEDNDDNEDDIDGQYEDDNVEEETYQNPSQTQQTQTTTQTVNETPVNQTVYQNGSDNQEPQQTQEVRQGVQSVQTGDTSNITVLLLIMTMSVIVLAVCQFKKEKNR